MANKVQVGIDFIVDNFNEWFSEKDFEWDEEVRTMNCRLHGSSGEYEFSEQEFLNLVEELKTLVRDTKNGFVRTRTHSFRIVSPVSTEAQAITNYKPTPFEIKVNDDITVGFEPCHFVIGVAALQEEAFDTDFHPPDSYPTIYIRYATTAKHLAPQEEEKLIESFQFEISAAEGLVFAKSTLNFDSSLNPFEDFDETTFLPKFRPLESHNEGMRLLNAAFQVEDAELRLLSLYKVLEYFAPIVTALDGQEALRKKLDSPVALSPDANYLKSVFELVRSLDKRRNDQAMISILLEQCIDFVELSPLLPAPFRVVKYSEKPQEIELERKRVSDSLVATRNQVAHAKSNYLPTGAEVSLKNLGKFNEFVAAAAVQTIRWYNRLPSHLKIAL